MEGEENNKTREETFELLKKASKKDSMPIYKTPTKTEEGSSEEE
ncbi:MAG: hypothetical protein ACQESF_03330 [Nanobdellota archaeon]